ncbi:hypothetical protein J2T15_006092 [Paenibacillus harenae]|uniref:AraC family transcriptional regulator n=1 Tax=Paenibacillus harenae TaxID=306543 RepID=A0ABT9UAF8_PAEHA|nr:hypothetical protein [Paenibacillus harenae]
MAYLPILHEKSKQFYWKGSGALSIKTFPEMVIVSCLSPNHFLRNYKLLFGFTPHQFIIEKPFMRLRNSLTLQGERLQRFVWV